MELFDIFVGLIFLCFLVMIMSFYFLFKFRKKYNQLFGHYSASFVMGELVVVITIIIVLLVMYAISFAFR